MKKQIEASHQPARDHSFPSMQEYRERQFSDATRTSLALRIAHPSLEVALPSQEKWAIPGELGLDQRAFEGFDVATGILSVNRDGVSSGDAQSGSDVAP
jgi:hypothetical protein